MIAQDPKNLIIEAKNGNASAFDALYRLYFTPVFRYLYARTWNREISEDLAQTTFVKALAGLDHWHEQGKNPLAYFFTIARNALSDHWNGERNIAIDDSEMDKVADTAAPTPTLIDHSLTGEILKRALSTLTDDQREILTLRYFGELDYDEISDATGKSEEAVRQHHSRALKALRGTLKGL